MQKGLIPILFLALALPGVARSASEQERNKIVARNFFEEVIGRGQLDKYEESHTKDFVAHAGDRTATLEEDLAYAREERKTLPDMSMTVNQMVAEGDRVAVYWTASGTNTQAGMGFPATGKKIKVTGMTLFRFQDGKIREEWGVWDKLSAMRQAGLLPSQP
ncbi:MAG: ester cyclase [Terriglobales bacterium]